MAKSANRISGFTRKPPRNAKSCAKPLAVDLSENAQKRVGDIFGVLKAEASEQNCDALIAHIEDALVRGVFEALRKLPRDASQESILESAIAKVNDALHRLLGEDGLALGPDTISGAVISQKGRELSAAIWGRPAIQLFHPTADGRIQIFDLTDDDLGGAGAAGKGFSQIVSGKMTTHDRLLLATENLRNPLGDEPLAEAVLALSPEAANQALGNLVSEAKQNYALAVFISDGAGSTQPAAAPTPLATKAAPGTAKTDQSIKQLIDTESKTKQIMSPPLWPSLIQRVKGVFGLASGKVNDWREDQQAAAELAARPKPRLNNDQPQPTAEPTALAMAPDSEATPIGLDPVAPPVPEEAPLPPPADEDALPDDEPLTDDPTPDAEPEPEPPPAKARFVWRNPLELTDVWLSEVVEGVNQLPRGSKVIIVALLAALTVLNSSSLVVGYQQAKAAVQAAYEQELAAIESKLDSAESSLIYGNHPAANQMLDEASSLIEVLPTKTEEEQQNQQSLRMMLDQRRKTANKIFDLSAPEVLASLNGENGPLWLARLAELNGAVYAAAESGQIFELDPEGGAEETAASDGSVALFLSNGEALLTANQEGQYLMVPARGEAQTGQLPWANDQIEPTDAVTWGARLYVLDATHNRLIRQYATLSGYGQPQFYLKDGTDVSQAISMAVDGSLWLLNADGSVTQIRLGNRQDFELQPINPPLTTATRLYTAEGLEHLWILDAAGQRVLAFDKETGALVGQYVSDRLGNGKDLRVDETAGELLVAIGHQVLRFKLVD
jgi:hypothetical protein